MTIVMFAHLSLFMRYLQFDEHDLDFNIYNGPKSKVIYQLKANIFDGNSIIVMFAISVTVCTIFSVKMYLILGQLSYVDMPIDSLYATLYSMAIVMFPLSVTVCMSITYKLSNYCT